MIGTAFRGLAFRSPLNTLSGSRAAGRYMHVDLLHIPEPRTRKRGANPDLNAFGISS